MSLKIKFVAAVALTAFQFVNLDAAQAAEIDKDLAILAAEQEKSETENVNTTVTTQSKENSSDAVKKKMTAVAEKTEEKSQPVEPEIFQPVEEKVSQTSQEKTSQTESEKVSQPEQENISQTDEENLLAQDVGLPNPIKSYANFEALAEAVNFTPLYIPKKSGYTIKEFLSIADQIAEIRYGRRWEPEVSLQIRTYKRAKDEELRDISGVQGTTWRIDMTSGTPVYISKIDERSHVAAWATGDYTFSAYVENLSFAAFHSLVTDELVDLTTHYYADTEVALEE